MLPLGSSQNIIKHVEMAFRFQLPVGNEGLFVVITTNQHYQYAKGNNYKRETQNGVSLYSSIPNQGYRTKSVAVNADGTS